VIAAALKHMFAAGMSQEQILAAVEDMELSGGLPLTPRQERNRRYYKRLKASETVLVKTDDPSPSPPYDNKNSSTPLNPIVTPLPPKREDRARRLPLDWQPSEGLLSSKHIQKLGLPGEVLSFETESFRDYFLGNGRRMIDWNRAWSNWMREALRRRGRGQPQKSNTRQGFERAFDRARKHDAASDTGNVVPFSEVSGRGQEVHSAPCDTEPGK
jgi:hypothetical protein